MSKNIKFNCLKIMLGYKKLDSRKFSLLLEGLYSSYQIGRMCSISSSDIFIDKDKDEKIEIAKKRFSEVLGINELLLNNDYKVDFEVDVLINRLRSNPSMSSMGESYYISVCVICVSLLYRFLVDYYKIMKLDTFGIKNCFNSHINKYERVKNNNIKAKDDLYCDVSLINKELLTSVILTYLGIEGKVVNNLIGFLESKGFIFFSFKGCGRIDLKSFSVLNRVKKEDDGVDDVNGIIFLRDDLNELEIRECVLSEVVRIIICVCYGDDIKVNDVIIDSIVRSLILQDCWKDKIVGIDLRSYSTVCKWMDTLRMSGLSLLQRLSEFGIELGSYFKMKEIGCDLDKFYNNIWKVDRDKNWMSNCKESCLYKDKVLLWEKVGKLSYSYEYISNVTGLSIEMINEFCFGVDNGVDSTVESHLKTV